MSRLTIVPAYGKDYRSKKEVQEAWDGGKDFMVQDMMSPWDGKYINKEDAERGGITSVQIRFKQMRNVHVVKVAQEGRPIGKDRLGGPWNWEIHEIPWHDDNAYLLPNLEFSFPYGASGIEKKAKKSFRIVPNKRGQGWKLDYWDFVWVAATPKTYRTPEDAAHDLKRLIESGDHRWSKGAAEIESEVESMGWDPGYTDDNGWQPGQVDLDGMPDGDGSQVPPPRDNQGNPEDKGESIDRVAVKGIQAAWDAFEADLVARVRKTSTSSDE